LVGEQTKNDFQALLFFIKKMFCFGNTKSFEMPRLQDRPDLLLFDTTPHKQQQ